MNKMSSMILKLFVQKFHPTNSQQLLQLLSLELRDELQGDSIDSTDLEPLLNAPAALLPNVHYSWLKPFIVQFPSHTQERAIACLTKEQQTSLLMDLFKTKSPIFGEKPSDVVSAFFLHHLYHALEGDHHLPLEYLPDTPFLALFELGKKKIVSMIDFLGLHDLAAEIRSMIDKKNIENVYGSLSREEVVYLKKLLSQKEKLVAPKFVFDFNKKNPQLLRKLIHQRGLVRLAQALAGQHPDFMWHFVHLLDSGRGKIISKLHPQEPIPIVTQRLQLQVLNLIHLFKRD